MNRLSGWKSDGMWLAALVLLLSLHVWFPDVAPRTVGDTYSPASEGKKVLYLLAQRHFDQVDRSTEPLWSVESRLDLGDTLCLLGPERNPTADEWQVLLSWINDGGSVVFAPSPLSAERIEIEDVGAITAVEDAIAVPLTPDTGLAGGALSWRYDREVESSWGETLVEALDTPQVVRVPYGRGQLLLVAGDEIFTNASLAEGDNAVLALRLLESVGDGEQVSFDESLNASGTPQVVGMLLDPLLRPMSVQLMILLLLFGWWRSRRFGPLLPRSDPPRHNIVDHTDMVGTLYWRSGDGAGVLKLYLRQFFNELRLRHYKGREDQLLAPIARRMNVDTSSVRSLLSRSAQAARSNELDRRKAADLIRELSHVRRASRPDESRKQV